MTIRWAVLGDDGEARERCRAIHRDPGSTLAAVWGTRAEGAPAADSPDQAVAHALAVAVHGPAADRAHLADLALRAGRHVVVGWPPGDADTLERLLVRARTAERVLHLSLPHLLAASLAALRAHVLPAAVRSVELVCERPGHGDLGVLLACAEEQLQRLVHVAGPLGEVDAQVDASRLSLRGELATGAAFSLTVAQHPELHPSVRLSLVDHAFEWRLHGESLYRGLHAQTLLEPLHVVHEDHARAVGRIRGEGGPYAEADTVLALRRLVEGLTA